MNKYFIAPLKRRFSTMWINRDLLDDWMNAWRFFFILGFGRSGTAFLAHLLNQAQGAHVFHEPVIEDIYSHLKAHYSQEDAERYIQGFRKKEIYLRMRHVAPGIYGEVNGMLRCHAKAIKSAFPEATMIHLVRDGRAVVRSSVGRRTMTFRNPFSLAIHPTESDPWKSRWDGMDRFSRLCWFWQVENARLRETIGKTVQLEKILSSYEYFHDEILEPCHVFLDKKDWAVAIASPRNITSNFQMPKWADWTSEQQRVFREICGGEMAKCGYEF